MRTKKQIWYNLHLWEEWQKIPIKLRIFFKREDYDEYCHTHLPPDKKGEELESGACSLGWDNSLEICCVKDTVSLLILSHEALHTAKRYLELTDLKGHDAYGESWLDEEEKLAFVVGVLTEEIMYKLSRDFDVICCTRRGIQK